MNAFFAAVMVLAAFGFVLFPLFKRSPRAEHTWPGDIRGTSEPLQEKKDSVYSSIQELKSDFEMGNLSRQDYEQLYQSYELKALQTLQDIDRINEERQEALSDEIEAAVRQLRRTQVDPATGKTCASCGSQLEAADQFCHHCGKPVTAGCPACGAAFLPGDRFCGKCGARLTPDG